MKFLSVIIFSLLSVSLILSSCAKVEGESSLEVSKTAWSLWMDAFRVENPQIKPLGDDGLFVETLTPAPEGAVVPEVGDWVRINYTGRTLQGNVYVTLDSLTAAAQNTATVYTNYVAQYVPFNAAYSYMEIYPGMPYGQYTALKTMKQGEKLRVYIPFFLGYGAAGTSFDKGFQGQYALAGGAHMVVDMEIVEVIKDIKKHEQEAVKKFALDVWHATDQDTVTSSNIYAIRYDTVGFVEALEPRDSITVDSTVKIYYKGMFLNGFVFDTNIDSVAQRVWNDFETKKALTYVPKNGELVKAFADVVPTMVYNEWAKMVFTSEYGYGSSGQSSGKTIIQPYAPLIFEFYIPTNIPVKKDEDEK